MVTAVLDWVNARWDCSPQRSFQLLKEGIGADVKAVSALGRSGVTFQLRTEGDGKLIVSRDRDLAGFPEVVSVAFELASDRITARNLTRSGPQPSFLSATPMLSEEGECMFSIGNESFTAWQIRRKALESLFFGF